MIVVCNNACHPEPAQPRKGEARRRTPSHVATSSFTSNPGDDKCAIHQPKYAVHCPKCPCKCDDFKAGKDLGHVVHAPKWPWKRKDPHHYYDFQQPPHHNTLTRRQKRNLAKHQRRLAKRNRTSS